MGASSGRLATARGQVQVRAVLGHLGAVVMPKPEVLVGNAADLIDEHDQLTDEATRSQIARMLQAFETWIERNGT
jgi:chromate reductase, NAD(P)H dehydrogenase (quinone)